MTNQATNSSTAITLPSLPKAATGSAHYRPPNGVAKSLGNHPSTKPPNPTGVTAHTTAASSTASQQKSNKEDEELHPPKRMSSLPSWRGKNSATPAEKQSRYDQLMHTTADAWDVDAIEDLDADSDEYARTLANNAKRVTSTDKHGTTSSGTLPPSQLSALEEAAAAATASIKRSNNAQLFGKNHLTSLSNYDPRPPETDLQTARDLFDVNAKMARFEKFRKILTEPNVDLRELRKLSWNGISEEVRPMAWQLMMGYLPCNLERREQTLTRKRKEYEECVAQAFARGEAGLDQTIWHQIHIDVPRTHPHIPLYQQEATQQALERILYCWAIRHPASGYVQGINDLLTPFFQVFLSSYIGNADMEHFQLTDLSPEILTVVEADSFWCMTKLLDGIQDNYTHGQPGIQRQISRLRELIHRIDPPLAKHLETESVEYIQFSFRWMNCLLMRELSLANTIRMWDTYLSEESDGFSDFHAYVCAAFLVKWSDKLRKMDFQEIITFLQSVPTATWTNKDVEVLLSEAFLWKTLFHNAPGHLTGRQ